MLFVCVCVCFERRQLICLNGAMNWQQEADMAPPQGQPFLFLLCCILVDINPVIEASGVRIKLIFISESLAKREEIWGKWQFSLKLLLFFFLISNTNISIFTM